MRRYFLLEMLHLSILLYVWFLLGMEEDIT